MDITDLKRDFFMRTAGAVVLVLSMILPPLAAQGSYTCDFEDEGENGQWILNNGRKAEKCTNKWFIDKAVNNGGERSLYVSSDSAETASYRAVPALATACRPLTLPAGEYEISFDWQAFGFDATKDAMYVCWVPDSIEPVTAATSHLSLWVEEYAITVDGTIRLNSSPWKASSGRFLADGTPYQLVFVWNNDVQGASPPAGCVDNICITPRNGCAKPKGIKIESAGTDVNVTWSGDAPAYDVRVKNGVDNVWTEYSSVTQTSLTITGIEEGLVDVYVRAACAEDTASGWVSESDFVFFKGIRCIDYLDIESARGIYSPKGEVEVEGIMDAGYASPSSHHTVHFYKDEHDPRTGGKLLTVPEDEVASVRLGNWDVNNEHESIEYDFHVDAESDGIFLLKYAVVLQDPKHNEVEQPHFMLSITKEDGSALGDYGCAEADFTSGFNTEDWGEELAQEVLYKDWSTVGINLQEYDGMDLKIKLTTFDCTLGGHYGYAYFTLSCDDGQIKGMSCGDSPMNSFMAPEGFNYRWYDSIQPEVTLGEEQIFSVQPDDTRTFGCDVIQPTNAKCYYTVYARAIPRYPVAEGSYEASVKDCQNIVKFTNESYVAYVDPETEDTMVSEEEMCDGVVWDFGDGTTSTDWEPRHVFPEEGGTFTVTMRSTLVDCDDVKSFEIDLPKLGTVTDTTHVVVCGEEGKTSYQWTDGNQKFYYYSDTVPYAIKNEVTGCDSVSVLDLVYCAPYDTVIYDTICSGEVLEIAGQEVRQSGNYVIDTVNRYGCDSTTTYSITVNESLELDMAGEFTFCADDDSLVMPYELSSGRVSTFSIDFGEGAMGRFNADTLRPTGTSVSIEADTALLPGQYRATLVFANHDCGDQTKEVTVNVLYPDTVIAQRWNDVLGVRNAEHNGGYDFAAYQWYENGTPLAGETGPNLYRPDGLDTGAEYAVMLTRLSDNVSVLTCPVVPQSYADIEVMPTVTFTGGNISVKSTVPGEARMWTATGLLVRTFTVGTDVSTVTAPSAAGAYILEVRLNDGSVRTEKIIVESHN